MEKCVVCGRANCQGIQNPSECPYYDVNTEIDTLNEIEEIEEVEVMQTKAEVKYNLKVKIKKAVEDKIIWLTHNYEEEISAFLTGEIKNGEIIIDGLLFPHQDVSGGSVEVEPKDLIKLRKEYGDECLRIIGHWHSHNTMGAFWSATDDRFIDSYSITKPISIFFVSSTISRCRVMLVMNKPFEIRLDNLDYETIWGDEKLENDLRQVIETKVTKKVYPQSVCYGGCDGYNYNQDNQTTLLDDDTKKEEVKIKINEAICYNASNGILTIKNLDMQQAETLANDTKNHKPEVKRLGQEDFTLVYKTENKKKVVELIEEIKFYLEDIFEEELNIKDYGNSNYYWGQ